MSLRKRCFFILLATIIAFIAAGGLNVPIKGLDVPTANLRPYDSTVAHNGSLRSMVPPAHSVDRSNRVKAFRARNDIRPTIFLPIQSTNAKDLSAGKLLVASRRLGDPNFAQTVVLLVRYDAEGVVGLVLNRRTDLPMSQVLEGIKAAKNRSDPVYSGGPVEPSVFALTESPSKIEGAEHIFGAVYMISTKPTFEQTISAKPDASGFHVYLGAAAWTAPQLRMEMALGAWFIFPADAGTVFDSDPDSLWPKMIKKTELMLAGSGSADAIRLGSTTTSPVFAALAVR
jgi:putative AlgH/UPF0301 family transcriptional regulator